MCVNSTRRFIFLLVLAPLALPRANASSPTRALVRGRQLHGYLLSLAKVGQTEITSVQRPKAGGALDTKIQGIGLQVDLTSCEQGGTPGVNLQQPVPATQTFSPGESITVGWRTTIPHDNSPGVRIAVRYVDKPGDTFAAHVLGNALESGQTGGTQTVQLPLIEGRAELMWSWASTQDGGYYVSCADVQIGNTGGDTGGNTGRDNVGTDSDIASPSAALINEEASTAVIVIGIIVIVGVIACVGYSSMNTGKPSAPPLGGGHSGGKPLPRPASQRPKSVAKGLRGTPASGLPAGWKVAVDGDGDTYYYTQDGRTSWELPTTPA